MEISGAPILGILLFVAYLGYRIRMQIKNQEFLEEFIVQKIQLLAPLVKEHRADPKAFELQRSALSSENLTTMERCRRHRLKRLSDIVSHGIPYMRSHPNVGLERAYDRYVNAIIDEFQVPIDKDDSNQRIKAINALDKLLNKLNIRT